MIAFVVISCTKDQGPEKALRSYVEYRFQKNQTKNKVLSHLTGPLKKKFLELNQQEFDSLLQSEGKRKKKLKITNKKCREEQCFITYLIAYETLKADKKAFTTEVKKVAELIRQGSKWLISDVNNIKTFHDSHEALDAMTN